MHVVYLPDFSDFAGLTFRWPDDVVLVHRVHSHVVV